MKIISFDQFKKVISLLNSKLDDKLNMSTHVKDMSKVNKDIKSLNTKIDDTAKSLDNKINDIIHVGALEDGMTPPEDTLVWIDNGMLTYSENNYTVTIHKRKKEAYIKGKGRISVNDSKGYMSQYSVKKVTILEGATVLDTFSDFGVEEVILPSTLTSIDSNAFYNCTSLTSIAIPNSVTSIGVNAFYNCTSLTSIAIPNSVTSIEGHAFTHCTSLTNATIPNSVTYIGDWAFGNCTSLTSVTIPNSVTSIGYYAFFHCSSLKEIVIPENVTMIGSNAFDGCSSVESLQIMSNKNIILSKYSFQGLTSLKTVQVPCNVQYSNSAFNQLPSLTSVTITPGEDGHWSPYSFAYSGSASPWIVGQSTLSQLVLEEGIKNIGNRAFSMMTQINRDLLSVINIPSTVESINADAFYNCIVDRINVPDSVTSIGVDAFFHVPEIRYNGSATGSPWGALSVVTE